MPKRVDANQAEIVRMLRDFGASVIDLHEVGRGCPDLLVGYRWRSYPMEVKSKGGKLTKDEIEFNDTWKGNHYIIRSIEDAIQIIIDGSNMED
jgi:hypothetical protein